MHRALVLAIVCGAMVAAHATSVALPETILCTGSHVIVGKVLSVSPKDCRLDAAKRGVHVDYCEPSNDLELEVEVEEILGTFPTAPAPRTPRDTNGAQRLRLISRAYEALNAAGAQPSFTVDVVKDVGLAERLGAIFVGKEFIYSVQVGYVAPLETRSYFTTVWRLTQREWVLNAMRSSEGRWCPVPVQSLAR